MPQALMLSSAMLQALAELQLPFVKLLQQQPAHAGELACLRFQT
jgi:hypothetical protein